MDRAQGTACSRFLRKPPKLGTHPIRTLRLNRCCAIAASSLSVSSLAGLLPLTFAQTDAWAAAVLVDEFKFWRGAFHFVLRKHNHKTQLYISHRTNIGHGNISDLESGRRKGTTKKRADPNFINGKYCPRNTESVFVPVQPFSIIILRGWYCIFRTLKCKGAPRSLEEAEPPSP